MKLHRNDRKVSVISHNLPQGHCLILNPISKYKAEVFLPNAVYPNLIEAHNPTVDLMPSG